MLIPVAMPRLQSLHRRLRLRLLLLVAVPAAGLIGIGLAPASGRSPRPADVYRHERLIVRGDSYRYSVFVPAGYRAGRAVPLVVVLHGCNATDDSQKRSSNYDLVAERWDFIVLYPDVDAADVRAGRCWKGFWKPTGEARGHGDAGAIAAMARAVMASFNIDRSRVYAIGMSSGAFEASFLGADYPDVFAAIGIHSGAAYMGATGGCRRWGVSTARTGALAREALAAMGARARVMPVILLHGDDDPTIPYRCGRQALAQWLTTDDLVLERGHRRGLLGVTTTATRAAVSGHHSYTVNSYRTTSGCTVLQFWTIHGMGHHWSGGASGPALSRYTDTLGPSAAAASWAFFAPLRLSGAGTAARCV